MCEVNDVYDMALISIQRKYFAFILYKYNTHSRNLNNNWSPVITNHAHYELIGEK